MAIPLAQPDTSIADAFETTIWAAEFQSWPTSGSDSLANGPEQQQSVTEGI